MKPIQFIRTDAWIIWAVRQDESGTDLPGLIAAADNVNHAIPTFKEINRGITKGLRTGILVATDHGIKYSDKYSEEIWAIIEAPQKAYDSWGALYDYLRGRDWSENNQDSLRTSEEDVNKAFDIYLRNIRRRK